MAAPGHGDPDSSGTQMTGISRQTERATERRYSSDNLSYAQRTGAPEYHSNRPPHHCATPIQAPHGRTLRHHGLVAYSVTYQTLLQGGQTRMHRGITGYQGDPGSEQLLIGKRRRLRKSANSGRNPQCFRVDQTAAQSRASPCGEHIILRRVHAPHMVHMLNCLSAPVRCAWSGGASCGMRAIGPVRARQSFSSPHSRTVGRPPRTVRGQVQQCRRKFSTAIWCQPFVVMEEEATQPGEAVGVCATRGACLLRLLAASQAIIAPSRTTKWRPVAIRVPCFGLVGETCCLQAALPCARRDEDRRIRHECSGSSIFLQHQQSWFNPTFFLEC